MPISNSINEPGGYAYEGLSPGSANEPPKIPAGAYAPKITSLVPNSCPTGGADITVKVTGTGFFEKSVCFVGAPNRPTTFNPADSSLSVTFKPSTRTPGTVKVVVRNGAYSSNAVDFTFT
jgi:IPT/TIG domain